MAAKNPPSVDTPYSTTTTTTNARQIITTVDVPSTTSATSTVAKQISTTVDVPSTVSTTPTVAKQISTVVDTPYTATPTVTNNSDTAITTTLTMSNAVSASDSYYASGVGGLNNLVESGKIFNGANVYVTFEEQQYITNNKITSNTNPGGSNSQVQFNDLGTFGGNSGFTFDKTTGALNVTGNIAGSYLFGNGSQLTGIVATYNNSNVVSLLANFGSNTIATTGNVTAGYFVGNGSQLTGLAPTYGNSNVATLMAGFGSNTISTTGNISGGYILGNGSQLTGIVSSYGNANVTTLLGNLGSNTISGTGNITTTANISGGFILGNISQANGFPATYGNSNVTTLLSAFGSNTISTTGNSTAGNISAVGNVSGNYFIGNGSQLTGIAASYGNANVATFLASFGSNTISTTGNITAGNVIANNVGNIAALNLNGNASTVLYGNGVFAAASASSSYGNANVATFLAAYGSNTINTTGNITAGNIIGNISITGNVTGTSANVTLVAGAYSWTFDNTGNLTLPGNTFSVNYANNTPVNAVTRFESAWAVPVGNSTQSFTVSPNETYYMWVDCNIPNGILTWNATATVTNTNVPVVGAQYAWVYNGGGTPIDFTSIPNQFVGTANTILRSSVAPSATTNRFDFGINNTSGNSQTVRYGWIAIS